MLPLRPAEFHRFATLMVTAMAMLRVGSTEVPESTETYELHNAQRSSPDAQLLGSLVDEALAMIASHQADDYCTAQNASPQLPAPLRCVRSAAPTPVWNHYLGVLGYSSLQTLSWV